MSLRVSLRFEARNFRNLPCSNTNFSTVETDRISVAINTSGVSWAIALDILNGFQ